MKRRCGYLRGLQDEVMDNDLLLVGEAQSVLANERDGEGDAVHGLLPTRPVNKFILGLRTKTNTRAEREGNMAVKMRRDMHVPSINPPIDPAV